MPVVWIFEINILYKSAFILGEKANIQELIRNNNVFHLGAWEIKPLQITVIALAWLAYVLLGVSGGSSYAAL